MPFSGLETAMNSIWTVFVRVLLPLSAFLLGHGAQADEEHLSGPYIHDNLAIYLVHGKSTAGPVPLTLGEALARNAAKIHETGEVNVIEAENLGDDPIFLQSGEIVKGGQQDRAIVASLLLKPHSGRTRVAVFCVENGRWAGRAGEDTKTFTSAGNAVPSREAKIAIKAAPLASPSEVGQRQAQVWHNVARIQKQLSKSLGSSVVSPSSQTSLQLSLEDAALTKAQAGYAAALQDAAEQEDDVVGYVFAVNGKISSADIYASNALFRKLWPELVWSAAAEAIAARTDVPPAPAPSHDTVHSFLLNAERGTRNEQNVTGDVKLETRESSGGLYFATKSTTPSAPSAAFIHRSYLAK